MAFIQFGLLPIVGVFGLFVFVIAVLLILKGDTIGKLVAMGIGLVIAGFLFIGLYHAASRDGAYEYGEPATALREIAMEAPGSPSAPGSVWTPGIENEFRADVYPSQMTAARSLGRQIRRALRQLLGADAEPERLIIFEEDRSQDLIQTLQQAIAETLPSTEVIVRPRVTVAEPNDLHLQLYFADYQKTDAPWPNPYETQTAQGALSAHITFGSDRANLHVQFVEKPWVEDFAAFVNNLPMQRFVVAHSAGGCTGPDEAERQALHHAALQIGNLLHSTFQRRISTPFNREVTTAEVLRGDFIVDRFAQSFDGTTSKIWRHAILLDGSQEKLQRLLDTRVARIRVERITWARMGFSVIGSFLLILVVYVLLNAATKGYYVWSLRVAGVLLALVSMLSIYLWSI